jgi:hypothetical protein
LIPSDAMPVKAEDIVAKSPDHNASSAMEVDVP